MKIYEFTMTDSHNYSLDWIIAEAQIAAERQLEFLYDEDTAFIRIDSVEHEGLPVQKGNSIVYQFVVNGEIVTKLEERLNNLEKDCKTILEHPSHHTDLLNMVLGEDVPELIKLARKASHAFKKPLPEGTGQVHQGYCDAICQLRKEIYD